MQDRIITSLDIGTTKICVVIAKVLEDNRLDIIGFGHERSYGLNKGVIINIDSTVNSIKKAVEEAELMAGVEVQSLTVGIAGGQVEGINSRGVIAVSSRESEIEEEDIARVLSTAQSISIPSDKEILHVIPQEFIVDDQASIMNPLGMSGVRLEAEVHLVMCMESATNNIRKSVTRAGYEVEEIVLQPIASAEAVLNDDEKELGAVVVDIGGGTTDVLMYISNSIWYTDVITLGGNSVTKDISYGLRTPNTSAEMIKKQYGAAMGEIIDENDYFNVPLVGGRPPAKVSRKMLAEIIEPRMEEIFNLIKQALEKTGYLNKVAAGVVLTGGASQCEGTIQIAERILNQPARVGSPIQVKGLVEKVSNPTFATAVGLARFVAGGSDEYRPKARAKDSLWSKVGEFLREFFN